MSKVPSARAIREARLNLTEALAHLDVAGKAIRAKNPVSSAKKAKVKKGHGLYKKFRKSQPAGIREYNLNVNDYENLPATYIGLLSAIEYTTVRNGKTERYRHEFVRMAQPSIYRVGRDKVLIRSSGGRFKFGKRGFVDERVWKRHNPYRPDYSVLVEVGTLDAYEFFGDRPERFVIPASRRPILAVTEAGTAIYTLKK